MKKRLLSLLMIVSMVFALTPMFVVTALASSADLVIKTVDELRAFRDDVNNGNNYDGKLVELTADIDLGGKAGGSWEPIGLPDVGNGTGCPFLGTFDGCGHTVSGMYISTLDGSGFFGYVKGGTVKNLKVDGEIVLEHVGFTSGGAGGVVYILAMSDDIDESGMTTGGVIENCSYSGSITGSMTFNGNVGGIVGTTEAGTVVTGCYNTSNIDVSGVSDYMRIISCVGGLIGFSRSEVTNCYNTGEIRNNGNVGGLIGGGNNVGECRGKVSNCYNFGKVTETGEESANGVLGGMYYGSSQNCYYLAGTASADDSGAAVLSKADFANQNSFSGWDFANVWKMSSALGRPVLQTLSEDGSSPSTSPVTPSLSPFFYFQYQNNPDNTVTFTIRMQTLSTTPISGTYTMQVRDSEGNWKGVGDTSVTNLTDGQTFTVTVPCSVAVGDRVRFVGKIDGYLIED